MTDTTAILTEITAPFADARVHHCQVDLTQRDDQTFALSGTVLDESTLSTLAAGLAERLPDAIVDLSAVVLLRRRNPTMRRVGTNLTGLFAQPSFGSEQVSQLLNAAPLEVLREREPWAFVRQPDGYLGWVYAPYLAEPSMFPPTHFVVMPQALLRTEPQFYSSTIGRLLGGTAVTVNRIEVLGNRASDGWAQATLAGGRTGWLSLLDLRRTEDLPKAADDRRRQIVIDAHLYVGVPYVWGGTSGMGIDCSGLAQLTHRLSGVTVPRDADMQFEVGTPIEPPFLPGDLLFFASPGNHRRITHVGISVGGWQIIHASRAQNGVYLDDVQAVDHLRETFVGGRSFLNR